MGKRLSAKLSLIVAIPTLASCYGGNSPLEECPPSPTVSITEIQEVKFGRFITLYNGPEVFQTQFFDYDDNPDLIEGTKAIRVKMSHDENSQERSWYKQFTFPIFKSAHASCAPATSIGDTNLTDIQIVSNTQFGEDRAAGINLADLFTLFELNGLATKDEGVSLNSYIANSDAAPLSFALQLSDPQNELTEQLLTISVTLDNGQSMFTADIQIY